MNEIDTAPSFWVRCIGYTQDFESYFTIGNEYEVCNGYIVNDNGYKYQDMRMKPESDPSTWFLATWYHFEIIDSDTSIELGITFDDLMN